MQTELMLRLIKDDKIVGYLLLINGTIAIAHTSNSEVWRTYNSGHHTHSMPYNSFELGIKVGDTWYFDGDLFALKDRPEEIFQLHYEIKDSDIDVFYWNVRAKTGDMVDFAWALDQCSAKRIGNIHEKENA